MSKKVIITGTSTGIGFELVKHFAAAGHEVLALSRNADPVDALGLDTVTSISFDLSQAEAYQKINDFVAQHWQSVDILINNAGRLLNKPFSETTMADFHAVYQTNVFGLAELTRCLLPFMAPASHVVNISSMGGVQGSLKFPGLAAYSSSKAAVIALTELLAESYKNSGIAFNVLALGAVQTAMLEAAFPGYQAPISAKDMARYIFEFSLTGSTYYNGKLLQVANTTP